jgi:hypothetical protein
MHGATAEEKEPSRRFIQAVKDLSTQYQKPVALQYNTEEEELAYIKRALGYPIFAEPEDALMALAVSRDHYRKQNVLKEKPPSFPMDRSRVKDLLQKARNEKRDLLLRSFRSTPGHGISSQITRYQGKGSAKGNGKLENPLQGCLSRNSHKSDIGVAPNLNDFHRQRRLTKMNSKREKSQAFSFKDGPRWKGSYLGVSGILRLVLSLLVWRHFCRNP